MVQGLEWRTIDGTTLNPAGNGGWDLWLRDPAGG